MKKLILFTAIQLLMFSNIYPQGGWVWQNPTVNGNTLYSVDMLNNNTGYASGNAGTIIKTTNNGLSWKTLNAPTTSHIYSVSFVDINIGYACGANGVILKTIDGGSSWDSLYSGGTTNLWSIQFLNTNTGYAMAFANKVFKTTDAGDTWTSFSLPGGGFFDMHFIDENTGHVVGNSAIIMRTTNGGANWEQKQIFDLNPLLSVFFLNSDTGFVTSSDVRKTTDGGDTWQIISLSEYINLRDIYFIDNNTGYTVAGENDESAIFKTTNGGDNWIKQLSDFDDELNEASFSNPNNGFAVGDFGLVYKTTNGGNNWISMRNSVVGVTLNTIHFPNLDTGYACGFGQVVKTTNGGLTWMNVNFPASSAQTHGIHFVNSRTGFLGSQNNNLYRTTDGAATWTIINPSVFSLYRDFYFINETTGYAAGAQGKIIKTTDGGLNWTGQATGTTWDMTDIKFYNNTLGYVSGIAGTLMKTTNGGVNWVQMTHPLGTVDFAEIDFYGDTGVAVTANPASIIRSTDGGSTWTQVTSPVGTNLTGIDMINSTIGFISGWGGVILKTTDAGANWFRIPSSTNLNLEDIYFPSENSAYVVGSSGTILHMDNGGTALSGIVRYEDNQQPVSSGRVMAVKIDEATNEIIVLGSGQINSGGNYSIFNLPEDTTLIVAYPNSEMDFVPTYYPSTIDWMQAVEVVPNGNMSNININVFRIEDSPPNGSISGGVFQEQRIDSNILDYAIVYAKLNGEFKNYSVSISNGNYNVTNLPYGNYEIFVSRIGFENETFQLNFNSGSGLDSVNIYMSPVLSSVTQNSNELPSRYDLKQNYPNPFNPVTKIQYSIPSTQHVKLTVYDVLGRRITSLVNTVQNAGIYTATFDGSELSSGIYFYMLEAKDFKMTKKMLLIK